MVGYMCGMHSLPDIFLQFRNECMWIRRLYNAFAYLWDNDDRVDRLMRATAPAFFRDLNRILQEYIYQRVCLITDLARTKVRTGVRENLTCQLLDDRLQAAGLLTSDVKAASAAMLQYREFLKPARNQAISHLDLEFAMGQYPRLGEHPADEVSRFFVAMQSYCDGVGRAVGVGPLDFAYSPEDGDVMDLIHWLERGLNASEAPKK